MPTEVISYIICTSVFFTQTSDVQCANLCEFILWIKLDSFFALDVSFLHILSSIILPLLRIADLKFNTADDVKFNDGFIVFSWLTTNTGCS